MQRYPVRREKFKELSSSDLKAKITEVFGTPASEAGEFVTASFGALKELKVGFDGKHLLVETRTEPAAPEADQMLTIKKYNQFLEVVTGYTSKERGKKLQQEAKKGAPA